MKSERKWYKAFLPDMKCRPPTAPGVFFQYAVGRTFELEDTISVFNRGFHYTTLQGVYDFYPDCFWVRICEVTPLGRTDGIHWKRCTDRIRVDRELGPDEIVQGYMSTFPAPDLSNKSLFWMDNILGSAEKWIRRGWKSVSDILTRDEGFPNDAWFDERARLFKKAVSKWRKE